LKYYIGSPIYSKAKINLENGKIFTVLSQNNSAKNKYVQSITLNGKPYNQIFITHNDIMQGGELIFKMGAKPNYSIQK
jgi:putative alpha-1,2-mannosidase